MKKSELQQIIKEEFSSTLKERGAPSLTKPKSFTLSASLGKFSPGDQVRVISTQPMGDDIKIVVSNGKITDEFYLDKSESIKDLI
jgi:dsDNA-specific endonuclease/ATPase MutS2